MDSSGIPIKFNIHCIDFEHLQLSSNYPDDNGTLFVRTMWDPRMTPDKVLKYYNGFRRNIIIIKIHPN